MIKNDITCSFAERLQLFQNELRVYWTKRFRVTLIFLTGFYSNITALELEKNDMGVHDSFVKIDWPKIGFLVISGVDLIRWSF